MIFESGLALIIGCALGYGLRQYLAGYLPEKGRHLATREDFQDILSQLRSTTRTVEEIKSQTSGELWLGQARWNFKRTMYVRLLHSLSDARVQLQRMSAIIAEFNVPRTPEETAKIHERFRPEFDRYKAAVDKTRRARMTAALVLSTDAVAALEKLSDEAIDAAGRHGEKYRTDLAAIIDRAVELLQAAASKDLLGLSMTVQQE